MSSPKWRAPSYSNLSLARRESCVNQQERIVEESKESCDRHSQELILKENALREKERLHGMADTRLEELRHAEAMHNQRENSIAERMNALGKAERRLERETSDRTTRYEDLLRPLISREHAVLQQESAVREEAAHNKRFLHEELRSLSEQKDAARQLEEKATALHQQAGDAKGRLAKKEAEVDHLRDAVASEHRIVKKRSEELEQRTRTVEWKEKELEANTRKRIDRDLDLRRSVDALERDREGLRVKQAEMKQQESAVAVQKLELKLKIQNLVQAEGDMERKMAKAAAREAAASRSEAALRERTAELREKEAELAALEASVHAAASQQAEREAVLCRQEADVTVRLRVVEAGEQELLAWLRELKWRETHHHHHHPAGGHSHSQADDATAPLLAQLQSMKSAYLTTLQQAPRPLSERQPPCASTAGGTAAPASASASASPRKERERAAGGGGFSVPPPGAAVGRRDPFGAAMQEAHGMRSDERRCDALSRALAGYRAKYRCLAGLAPAVPPAAAAQPPQDDESCDATTATATPASPALPPLGGAAPHGGGGGGGGRVEGDALASLLLPSESGVLGLAIRFEGMLSREQGFLRSLQESPLVSRMNSVPDGVAIREMEEWATRLQGVALRRYREVLSERQRWLSEAVGILRRRAGPVEDRGEEIETLLRSSAAAAAKQPRFEYREGHVLADVQRAHRLVGTQKVATNVVAAVRSGKEGVSPEEATSKKHRIRNKIDGRGAPKPCMSQAEGGGGGGGVGKPKRLTPLDAHLRLAGVQEKPFAAYLKHYFDPAGGVPAGGAGWKAGEEGASPAEDSASSASAAGGEGSGGGSSGTREGCPEGQAAPPAEGGGGGAAAGGGGEAGAGDSPASQQSRSPPESDSYSSCYSSEGEEEEEEEE